MAKIEYIPKKFGAATLEIIDYANEIVDEYRRQGFDLTLRQIYYVFVSRGMIPNKDSEYKRLGAIISDARLAGLIDWGAIVDRTRKVRRLSNWANPQEIIDGVAWSYRLNKWENQDNMVEVWIEKDALVGVFEPVCQRLDVPLFSCRGYTSQSEMWAAAQRLLDYINTDGHTDVTILHFGDHDSSGIDMSRDIEERLYMFMEGNGEWRGDRLNFMRMALNMSQVRQFNPPPNPAKITDPRARKYIAEYGQVSWELDALDPTTLASIVQRGVTALRNEETYKEVVEREKREKTLLKKAKKNWDAVAEFLEAL